MAHDSEFQNQRGTALAQFTQGGTFSDWVQLNGWLTGMYSSNWPGASGSVTFRASWDTSGTGWPVQTADGTALKVLAFGSGTFYSIGHAPWNTLALGYVRLQVAAGGTAGVAAGGTIVLVTEA